MNTQLHNQNKPFASATLRKDTVDKPLADGILIMENTNEIWKDVVGYEGLYQVSNFGRAKALKKEWVCGNQKSKRTQEEKVLRVGDNGFGYYSTRFCKSGKLYTVKIHRLVAIAFVLNPENKPQVNHVDGNKKNNHVSNLEWVDNRANSSHLRKTNKTGAYLDKRRGMWYSRIMINGEVIRSQYFKKEEDASDFYKTTLSKNAIINKYAK